MASNKYDFSAKQRKLPGFPTIAGNLSYFGDVLKPYRENYAPRCEVLIAAFSGYA